MMGTRQGFLEICAKVEEACGAIYRRYAEIFTDDQELCSLWFRLGQEEFMHADAFRHAAQRYAVNDAPMDCTMNYIEEILEKVVTLSHTLSSVSPNSQDALLESIILERTIEQYHTEMCQYHVDQELGQVLKNVASEDRGHIQILRRACQTFGLPT